MVLMSVGLTGIFVLISNLVFGATAALVASVCAIVLVGVVWFAVPLGRRARVEARQRPRRAGSHLPNISSSTDQPNPGRRGRCRHVA